MLKQPRSDFDVLKVSPADRGHRHGFARPLRTDRNLCKFAFGRDVLVVLSVITLMAIERALCR
jgi:hypothetical protein